MVEDSPTQNTVILNFDVKNNSATAYDIEGGSTPINLNFVVTTTDGAKYESTAPLTVVKLSPGASGSAIATADYGAGKTYQGYAVTKSCR